MGPVSLGLSRRGLHDDKAGAASSLQGRTGSALAFSCFTPPPGSALPTMWKMFPLDSAPLGHAPTGVGPFSGLARPSFSWAASMVFAAAAVQDPLQACSERPVVRRSWTSLRALTSVPSPTVDPRDIRNVIAIMAQVRGLPGRPTWGLHGR